MTQDEQILHHYAAVVKNDLEAYKAHSRSQEDWEDLFRNHLACFILVTIYKEFSDLYRRNHSKFITRPMTKT
jgi:hypothetical protein